MIYDISYCQKGLNLKDLPDCERVIIRIGVRDHEDTECRDFISQALSLNIPFDFYWYICCTHGAAAAVEAKYITDIYSELCKRFKLRNVRLWFDIEDNNTLSPFNTTFPILLEKCRAKQIFNLGLYTFKSAIDDKRVNYDMPFMKGIPLWLAWHNKKQQAGKIKKLYPQAVIWQVGALDTITHITVDYNYKLTNCIITPIKTMTINLYESSLSKEGEPYSGELWRYDKDVINGRVRVTNLAENVMKYPLSTHVTGWVNLKEWFEYDKARK